MDRRVPCYLMLIGWRAASPGRDGMPAEVSGVSPGAASRPARETLPHRLFPGNGVGCSGSGPRPPLVAGGWPFRMSCVLHDLMALRTGRELPPRVHGDRPVCAVGRVLAGLLCVFSGLRQRSPSVPTATEMVSPSNPGENEHFGCVVAAGEGCENRVAERNRGRDAFGSGPVAVRWVVPAFVVRIADYRPLLEGRPARRSAPSGECQNPCR